MNNIYKTLAKRIPSLLIIMGFIVLSYRYFDLSYIWEQVKLLFQQPLLLLLILAGYFLSFSLKAAAWKLYLRGRAGWGSCFLGLFYSLLINHLLPIKAGDAVRAAVMASRETNVGMKDSIHSVIALRLLDLAVLLSIATAGMWSLGLKFGIPAWPWFLAFALLLLAFAVLEYAKPAWIRRQIESVKFAFSGKNGCLIFLFTLLSWCLEGSVIYGTVFILGGNITVLEAVWLNSITVAGQVFQITPGGIANYEAIMAYGLNLLGFPLKEGYTLAILSHGIKFFFSYLAGAAVILVYPLKINEVKKWIGEKGKELK